MATEKIRLRQFRKILSESLEYGLDIEDTFFQLLDNGCLNKYDDNLGSKVLKAAEDKQNIITEISGDFNSYRGDSVAFNMKEEDGALKYRIFITNLGPKISKRVKKYNVTSKDHSLKSLRKSLNFVQRKGFSLDDAFNYLSEAYPQLLERQKGNEVIAFFTAKNAEKVIFKMSEYQGCLMYTMELTGQGR